MFGVTARYTSDKSLTTSLHQVIYQIVETDGHTRGDRSGILPVRYLHEIIDRRPHANASNTGTLFC